MKLTVVLFVAFSLNMVTTVLGGGSGWQNTEGAGYNGFKSRRGSGNNNGGNGGWAGGNSGRSTSSWGNSGSYRNSGGSGRSNNGWGGSDSFPRSSGSWSGSGKSLSNGKWGSSGGAKSYSDWDSNDTNELGRNSYGSGGWKGDSFKPSAGWTGGAVAGSARSNKQWQSSSW